MRHETSSVGSLDVHLSTGVANHAFFMMAAGSGKQTVNGVGYRALTVYMTSTTNFKGARTATLNAAKDLFGTNSAQYRSVAAAWTAVNVK
jgi:zinc metalloprotease ZmpA